MKGLVSFHAIEGELQRNSRGARLFYGADNKRIKALCRLAAEQKVPCQRVSAQEIARMAKESHCEGELRGVFLQVSSSPAGEKKKVPESRFRSLEDFLTYHRERGSKNLLVLLLDGITDPQNLGALYRSADLFALDLLILPQRRSASLNETVARISVGASGWVPTVEVTNLKRTQEALQGEGFWIYGADMGGSRADQLDLKGRVALVLGSEGKGLSRLVREGCDGTVSIPTQGHVDSLNVSVAGGILLYEVRRQQGFWG